MTFDIIVNSTILELGIAKDIDPADNKWLLSLINGFEDGQWRQDVFVDFIWDNISQTALSHKERESLRDSPRSTLVAAAKNLRFTDAEKDIGKGSEIGEIVLYGIMKHHYNALPVVPKIFYKQNVQDNAKGADSVHIVIGNDGDFTLWFGEAKFFSCIEDARLGDVVTSVHNSLNTAKLKKENSIILNLPELDSLGINSEILSKIKQVLANKNSIDDIKPLINIPILLLHECPITKKENELSKEYISKVREYHLKRAASYFKKQVSGLKDIHKYEDVKFHLILFPVPQKKLIVDKFVETVKQHKN